MVTAIVPLQVKSVHTCTLGAKGIYLPSIPKDMGYAACISPYIQEDGMSLSQVIVWKRPICM